MPELKIIAATIVLCTACCAQPAAAQGALHAEARAEEAGVPGSTPRADAFSLELSAAAADASDAAILRHLLYGTLSPEELTQEQAGQLLAAAERRVENQLRRLDRQKALVAEGAVSRLSLTPLLEELDSRRRELDLARRRVELFQELLARTEAEAAAARAEAAEQATFPLLITERYDGRGVFRLAQFQTISREFFRKFGKPIPVSAYGQTALHQRLGYDHRGRVDVAVDPDSPEGIWLRTALESLGIPYYAFRGAIPGRSTAAHIHIGPSSLRLAVAD